MKKSIALILIGFTLSSAAVVAQDAPAPSKAPSKGVQQQSPAPAKPAGRPTQSPKKKKGPSEEKIRHAEERSKGNAFSGEGKGGDKNRVEPQNKSGKSSGKKGEHEHREGKEHGPKK